MEHLSANLERYSNTQFTLGDDNTPVTDHQFINEMSVPGRFRNAQCIMLLVAVILRPIRVFSRQYDNEEMDGFIIFEPFDVSVDDSTFNILHLGDGVGHYQCVCRVEDSTNSNDSDVINEPSSVPNFLPASPEIEKRQQKQHHLSTEQFSGDLLPVSPELVKRREKRRNMTPDNKAAQKENDKLRKKRRRDDESPDAHAMRIKKIKENMIIIHKDERPDASAA